MQLRDDIAPLSFSEPVTHVYNPLEYAWEAHQRYLSTYGNAARRVVMLGMNPGPWGMAQTGVPFGEISYVRDWMGIEAPVDKPSREHPRRPIEGFACTRSEVSGRRLWGLFAERYPDAERFFQIHMVLNYCPLVFMESSGRNRTPDKLSADEKARLTTLCDRHLRQAVAILEPEWMVGVGAYAADCFRRVFPDRQSQIAQILHPSPASPAANRDWAGTASQQLEALGIWQAP